MTRSNRTSHLVLSGAVDEAKGIGTQVHSVWLLICGTNKQILQLEAKPWIIISALLRDAEYLLAEANRGMSRVFYLKSEKCLS